MLVIRSLPSFVAVDDDGLAYLAQRARLIEAQPGDVLREEGDPATQGWVLVEGAVQTSKDGQPLARVEAPGVLGLLSVAAGDERGVRAEVVAPSRMLEIPIEVPSELMESNFSFARNVLRNLARNLLNLRGNLPATADFERTESPTDWPDPLTLVDRIRIIRDRGLFASVNMEAAIDLARHTRSVELVEGEVLWEVGEPADRGLRILQGQIECSTDEGEVRVGDRFALGVLEMLADVPRRYRARVAEGGRAVEFGTDAFLDVLEGHPGVLQELIASFAQSTLKQGR